MPSKAPPKPRRRRRNPPATTTWGKVRRGDKVLSRAGLVAGEVLSIVPADDGGSFRVEVPGGQAHVPSGAAVWATRDGERVNPSTVQAVAFPKHAWSKRDAVAWLKGHRFKAPAPEDTDNFWRYRQREPKFTSYGTLVRESLGRPIHFVIGGYQRSNPGERALGHVPWLEVRPCAGRPGCWELYGQGPDESEPRTPAGSDYVRPQDAEGAAYEILLNDWSSWPGVESAWLLVRRLDGSPDYYREFHDGHVYRLPFMRQWPPGSVRRRSNPPTVIPVEELRPGDRAHFERTGERAVRVEAVETPWADRCSRRVVTPEGTFVLPKGVWVTVERDG